MRRLRKMAAWLIFLALAGLAGLLLYGHARNHPEDLPWTELDLTQEVGLFTGRKLAGLHGEADRCSRLLDEAGVRHEALPPRRSGQCGYDDAVRFAPGGSRAITFRPAGLATSCTVAAALALWEWHVLQPAAQEHLGSRIEAIEHLGSYSCRRIGGGGEWSEHARANAVDIAAFHLADGRRVSVVADWAGDGPEARFLREARDGACDLFATVLSPEYDEAHRDHFHLDQAPRGQAGWRACR